MSTCRSYMSMSTCRFAPGGDMYIHMSTCRIYMSTCPKTACHVKLWAACGGRVWYLWFNDLAPSDTYLPISMMFSTGQTIPYLPRRGEHHPNPSAHNPVTTTVRTEHVLFEKQSRQVKRSSQMHRGWGPLLTWHSPDFFFRCDVCLFFWLFFWQTQI